MDIMNAEVIVMMMRLKRNGEKIQNNIIFFIFKKIHIAHLSLKSFSKINIKMIFL